MPSRVASCGSWEICREPPHDGGASRGRPRRAIRTRVRGPASASCRSPTSVVGRPSFGSRHAPRMRALWRREDHAPRARRISVDGVAARRRIEGRDVQRNAEVRGMKDNLVPDWEKSEHGPQRRKNSLGNLLHCCCICGKLDVWSAGWSAYYSLKDLDDEVPIPKFCSRPCISKGGVDASAVTLAMLRIAKNAEWRNPKIAYRLASSYEKYMDALSSQLKGPSPV